MKSTMSMVDQNPDLFETMTNVMKNVPKEEMNKLMENFSKDRKPDGSRKTPQDLMQDPEMIKTAEQMMKAMPPDLIKDTMKQQGVEMSDRQAKVVSTVIPFLMACWRYILYLR